MKARLLIVLFLLLCVTPAHATVNEVFARNDYVGNASTTSFPYTFRIINQADVMVLLNSVLQTLNVEYTVLGVDNPGGGAIVFATAPPAGQKVALLRAQRFQQLSIYTPNEAFPAKRIESDLDKNSMVDQRQEEEIGRALKFDPYSLYRNVFVDDPIAGNCLVWNASLTRVASTPCAAGGGGIPGDLTGAGTAGQVTFWAGPAALAGDGKFLWDNSTKALTVGTTPLGGPLKPGNVFIGLQGPANDTGMQTLMVQTHQGAPGLAGLVTLGADRVGISSWNFRGTGATNPIYGANFGVVFNTDGVANGLEIDVQNMTTTPNSGQALWLNGSGTGERANAILIDTQDATKWQRGILFKEGFVANGATGSISGMGIHFERSQDADFIVIQPRLGTAGNVAMKLTNPAFTLNRFELLNSGTLHVSNSMTGPAFPSYSFIEGAGPTAGMYLEAVGIAATPPGPGGIPPAVPASGGVLGWSINGLRRLTLGDALNVWNAGAGANQGGTVNLFDPTSVHSVGLMAPDFVGNSFRMKLPTVPGFTGQCLITDAGFPISQLSFAACGTGGGGGGGTVTNTGVLGANQLILGDGGVAIKGMGTLGTATTVLHGNPSGPPIFAGIGPADLSATGTANSTTFLRGDWTWAVPGGSGTVTTSGSPVANQVPFYTSSTVISGDPHFRWSNLGKQLLIGIASDPTSPSQALVVAGATAGSGDGTMQVWGTATGGSPTTNPPVPLTLIGNFNTGSMPTGFGATLELALRDGVGNAFVSGFINTTAQIISPPTTTIVLGTQVAGVPTPLMSLDTGQALFGRQVTSQVANAINPTGGTFLAAKSYAGGSAAANDGLGALIFSGEGVPGVSGTAAQILSNVDATGGSRIKGRLTFHTSDGTTMTERLRISSTGLTTLTGTTTMTGNVTVGAGLVVNGVGALAGIALRVTGQYAGLENYGPGAGQTATLFFRGLNAVNFVGFKGPDTPAGNFVWILPSTLGVAGSVLANDGAGNLSWAATGTAVTTTGSPGANQFTFMSGTNTITSSPSFSFDAGSGVVSLSGAGTMQIGLAPTVARTLNVTSGSPPARFERSDASTTAGTGTALQFVHTTSAQMTPNFDVLQTFILRDADGVDNVAGILRGFRDAGGSDSVNVGFQILAGGAQITMDSSGQFNFTPTPTIGSFMLQANGTRVTELKIATNNNSNYVGFTAPATATGNHMWRLPSTFGAANSIMFHDGAGNMGWATGLNTTATVRNAAGSGTCTMTFVSGVLTSSSC